MNSALSVFLSSVAGCYMSVSILLPPSSSPRVPPLCTACFRKLCSVSVSPLQTQFSGFPWPAASRGREQAVPLSAAPSLVCPHVVLHSGCVAFLCLSLCSSWDVTGMAAVKRQNYASSLSKMKEFLNGLNHYGRVQSNVELISLPVIVMSDLRR